MIVVADTSPLNYLLQLQIADILASLYGRVWIPSAVLTELTDPKAPEIVQQWATAPPHWVGVQQPPRIFSFDLQRLDLGERSAIELAVVLQADRILMDDRRGAVAAESLGLQVTGTLGVLRDAHKARLVDARLAYDQLKSQTNFRDSQAVADLFRKSLIEQA